ncbi:MAG: aminotransferase class IV [Spirochaetales bacterium]|nr:aminotransferase class IV [Spirochaetales bacterium]
MNKDLLGKFYIRDGSVLAVTDDTSIRKSGDAYEVIRLIGGMALFLDEHLRRLQFSMSCLEMEYPGDKIIRDALKRLCDANSISSANILVSLFPDGAGISLCAAFIPFIYPSSEDYQNGVRMKLYPHDRGKPGIKRFDADFRSSVSDFIRQNNIYEALLVNQFGLITEGSRSNIFFIRSDGIILTSPIKQVLPGITRDHVFKICAESGFKVKETMLHREDLWQMESCFITGTSPKVLPVSRIEHHYFEPQNPVLRKIMQEFDNMIEQNLSSILS